MYAIDIATTKFQGVSIVKQHRMVNEILKEEIKGMHGLQVFLKCNFFFYLSNRKLSFSSRQQPNKNKDTRSVLKSFCVK
jgi:hypothetical protein